MICYLCEKIQDYHETGLCTHCRETVDKTNERLRIYALLSQAKAFTPWRLREEIQKVLERK